MNPHLLPKVRSAAIREAMREMDCTLRIASLVPGHRCAPPSTVVGAHLPVAGRGVGTKASDLAIVAACAHCHDLLDRRDARYAAMDQAEMWRRCLLALCETHSILVGMEVLVVPKSEQVNR